MKYAIIGETKFWRAFANSFFNGKPKRIAQVFDTLQEANAKLLIFFNIDYKKYCKNWGNAVATGHVNKTFNDGSRAYEHDGIHWYTQEIEDLKDEWGQNWYNWMYEGLSWNKYLKLLDKFNLEL